MQGKGYNVIPLVNGGGVRAYALVDCEEFERVSAYRWYLNPCGYAIRSLRRTGFRNTSYGMHRDVLGLRPGDGLVADHINRNRLDNRRANLRAITQAQNQQNRGSHSATGYRGVCRRSFGGKCYEARVTITGRRYHLGTFETAEEADAKLKAFRAEHMLFSEDADSREGFAQAR